MDKPTTADREPGAVVAYVPTSSHGGMCPVTAGGIGSWIKWDDWEAMRARAEVAEQDAARYRWLRDNCFQTRNDVRQLPYTVIDVYLHQSGDGYIDKMVPGKNPGVGIPSLDTAIDTAIAEQERGS